MNIRFVEVNGDFYGVTAGMITDLMNYHRKLTIAPRELWQTNEQSLETMKEWQNI